MKKTQLQIIYFLFIVLFSFSCKKNNEPAVVINSPTTVSKGDPIPFIKIKTNSGILDEPKVRASMSIEYKDSTIFSANVGIEFRGAISQLLYEKKSYGIEIWDDKNEGISKSILGFPEEEDWVLYGPYGDKTLIKNALAYQISNNIGRYASRTKFVELQVNNDYQGFYILMEKLKRDKNRINIKKLEVTDNDDTKITGGYILKLDKTVGEGYTSQNNYNSTNSFTSLYNEFGKLSPQTTTHFLYDYPKLTDITAQQKAYITKYVQAFEATLASNVFSDETTGFRKYIDEDSFVDFFILTELMQNYDGYRISTYLQKERGEKLKMGPIWDFDLSLGSKGFCDPMNRIANAWIYKYNSYCGGDTWLVPFWWSRLLEDKKFTSKVKTRWTALRKNELSDDALSKIINDQVDYINKTKVGERNFQRWNILGKPIVPNASTLTYDGEISQLKTWLKTRTAWLDTNIMGL
jgi:hypothetical protein